MKRKVIRTLGNGNTVFHRTVVIRDPSDDRYPYNPPVGEPRRKWFSRNVVGLRHDGIEVEHRESFAYVADDRIHWDYIEQYNASAPPPHQNPWDYSKFGDDIRLRTRALSVLEKVPERNRATLFVRGLIQFEDILDIDEFGDEEVQVRCPHVFVTFDNDLPYSNSIGWFAPHDPELRSAEPDDEFRTVYFATDLPELPEQEPNTGGIPIEES
jgi:hypothetical protein